jgi:hypothetical protein
MTDFTPKIKYSDEASEVFWKHRDYQRQKEKNKNKNIENREELGYATIDWSRFNDKSAEKAESFFKEYGSNLTDEKLISIEEYNALFKRSKQSTVFFDEKLIDWLKLNPENKVNVLLVYKDFAIVKLHSKQYIVPCEMLVFVEKEIFETEITGNELAIMGTNQLALKTNYANAIEQLEKTANFEDAAFETQLAEIENLKAQMEAKISAMYEMQAQMMSELQAKIERYQHELLVMRTDLTAFEYRHGLTIDFTRITSGECAPVEQPIVVYQKLIYLDEDLPRFEKLYDVDAGSLEVALKHSPALLEHICPTNKGVSFLKMRNASGKFELNNTVMKFIEDTMPNQIGVLVRNGENTWLTWLDSDKVSFSQDSFASVSSQEKEPSVKLIQSRYYVFSIILGLIERGEMLQLDHVPIDVFSDPSIILSNADSQITDSTYIELGTLLHTLNDYSKPDDPIFILNSFTDQAKYHSYYGGGTTERGRGDNALTNDTSVKRGMNKIRGIDYFSDFTYRFYVAGVKGRNFGREAKISPSLYIESDEFINIKFLTSTLIDYYIHTKRIGHISNSGRYVNYSHMLPILFEIKKELEKQEKEDRLYIVSKDYDLNLLTSFKIVHDVRVVSEYQAKRYSKWVQSLTDEEKTYFKKLLIINDLEKYIRHPKAYAAISDPVILEAFGRYKKDCEIFSVCQYAQPMLERINGQRKEFEYYEESLLRSWGSCRIKTFGSEKALEKVISNPDNIYQKEYYRDRKSKVDGHEPEFGERKWNIVDFYDTENNKLKVKEAKEIQEKIKEENNKKNT